jgi:hypothetical protein
MSTTEEPQVSSTVDPVRSSGPSPIDRLRRSAGPACLAAGAALAVTGMALHVAGDGSAADEHLMHAIEAHSTQWLVSHLVLAAGMALIAGGAVAIFGLARGRGAALTAVGAGLMAVGAVLSSWGDISHGALAYALAGQVDAARSLEIQNAYFLHPAVAVLSFGSMLLPLGVVVLGIGLLRSRVVPRWAAAVLLGSPVLITVGFASGYRMLLLGIPFAVGLCVVARAVARAGRPA